MGQNINPGFQSGVKIEGRPEEFNKLLERQGQLIRLIHAKKCSCLKNGQVDLFCSLCGGKGYRLFFQEELEVYKENSPHGICGDETKISPFFIPISSVKSVQRRIHECQGGLTDYEVASFTDTEITIVDNNNLPKRYEKISVSYNCKNANVITDENSTADGTYIIETTGTKFTDTHIADVLNVYGDITKVTRVYNVTQTYTYIVSSFKKNLIFLDDETGSAPAPLVTDVLEVDYEYIKPFWAGLIGVETSDSIEKWGEDVKQGDIRIILPGYYYVGRHSIVTAMTTILTQQVVIKRGAGTFDELPTFDAVEIIGNIEDQEGNVYDSTMFEIQEFNNLVWIGATKPTQGKQYSLTFKYRPSYMVYRQESKTINLGKDKRYPVMTFGRFLNRFSVKDFDKI